MKNLVGPTIKKIRRGAKPKLTQAELAARLQALGVDIERSAIAKIEGGNRPVTDLELAAFCKSLGVKLTDLFPDDL